MDTNNVLNDCEVIISTTDFMDHYPDIVDAGYTWWHKHPHWSSLKIPFKPALEFFKAAVDAQAIFAVIIRDKVSLQNLAVYVATNQRFIFNPELSMAAELFWYVEESKRQNNLAKVLLEAVRCYLESQKIHLMTCSIAHIDSEDESITQKKVASLSRLGYTKTDTVFYRWVS